MRLPVYELDPAGGAPGQAPVIDPTGMFAEWGDVATGGTGTGVGNVPHDFAKRNSGNLTVSSTTWADVDNTLDLTVDAEAGDTLLVVVNGTWNTEVGEGHLNAATVVSGSPLNLIEPTATNGVGGWWGRGGVVTNIGAGFAYTVQAGDVVAGQVTLRLRARQVSGNKLLVAGSARAFQWSALNVSRVGQDVTTGGGITVQDENGNVGTGVTQIDFQGAGVTATAGTGGEVVVTIAGGGAGGDIDGGTWDTVYSDFIDGGTF